MKRAFDILAASAGLLILSPIIAVLALAILVDDPGPIIFRGRRIGRDGREFRIFKFRSMRVRQTYASELTVNDDPRVTRVGRLLRATKLDEIPQLLNVLLGEMSFVGPRPESPHYVAWYTPEQRAVLSVRPGITGKATIFFRHEERLLIGPDPQSYYKEVVLPAKLAMELEYVARHSFVGDLKLLGLTFLALVRPLPQPAMPQPQIALPKPALSLVAQSGVFLQPVAYRARDDRGTSPALEVVAANG